MAEHRRRIASQAGGSVSDDPTVDVGSRRARRRSKARGTATEIHADHGPARLRFAVTRLDAGDRYAVIRAALVQRFGISNRTAERDLARAYAGISAEHEAEAPTIAARIAARVWRLAVAAERRRDGTGALAAYDRLIRLHGLGVERISMSRGGDPCGGLTSEELTILAGLRLSQPPRTVDEARAVLAVLALTPAERNASDTRLAATQTMINDTINQEDGHDEGDEG